MLADQYKSDKISLKESFGVLYPEVFTDAGSEYRALTTTAGLLDLCHWGALRLTGTDRTRLLNALTTNDVQSLAAGQACHSALVTIKGKLVAELYILRRKEELFVLVAQGNTAVFAETIDKHIIADDVIARDVSGDYGVVGVEGPKSREIAWRLFPTVKFPDEPLRFVDTDYLGTPVTIICNSVTGEPGYHFVVPADGIQRVRDYLIQSGRADDMALAGRAAWNTRRIEEGIPWWGADITAGENFPKECRLEGVVSYNKGCYLGQETLARMHYRGHPNWLLSAAVPTDSEGGGVPPAGSELFAPADLSKAVCRVTSAVESPALEKLLIMGYIRSGFADPGTELVLRAGDSERTFVITSLPVK
jgi:folate-binding protein YgfZ